MNDNVERTVRRISVPLSQMSGREALAECMRIISPLVDSASPEQAFALGWLTGQASRAVGAAKAEREACARVLDAEAKAFGRVPAGAVYRDSARLVRARGGG